MVAVADDMRLVVSDTRVWAGISEWAVSASRASGFPPLTSPSAAAVAAGCSAGEGARCWPVLLCNAPAGSGTGTARRARIHTAKKAGMGRAWSTLMTDTYTSIVGGLGAGGGVVRTELS